MSTENPKKEETGEPEEIKKDVEEVTSEDTGSESESAEEVSSTTSEPINVTVDSGDDFVTVQESLVSSLDKNRAFFRISQLSLAIAIIAIFVVFISIWIPSKPSYTHYTYPGVLSDSIAMDTTYIPSIIKFEESKMKAYYESRISYREDMIELLKAVLLNFLLPILTAVIGYLAGVNKSGGSADE